MTLRRTFAVSLTALLAAVLWSDAAFAHRRHHHRHHHHGARIVFFTAPVFVPRYYYPAPVYYAPPPAPPVYVEQPQQGYWHYCAQANAYYPQVQTCPGGWQLVSPQPPRN